ncbi:hypothetical protein C0992_007657, partial [Termitomyces sp. T32_za158]
LPTSGRHLGRPFATEFNNFVYRPLVASAPSALADHYFVKSLPPLYQPYRCRFYRGTGTLTGTLLTTYRAPNDTLESGVITGATNKSGISKDLIDLQKIARRHGVRTEGLAFEREMVRARPIWFHGEAADTIRRLNHGTQSECLKTNHDAYTVGDMEKIVSCLLRPDHSPSEECECRGCLEIDMMTGDRCKNPHACAKRAKALLDTLPPKWDPRTPLPRLEPPRTQEEYGDDVEEWTEFDKNMITKGPLSEAFRIFTEGEREDQIPDLSKPTEAGSTLILATDGSCEKNGDDDAKVGAGVFYKDGSDLNLSVRVPSHLTQSNQTGELLALKEAVEAAPNNANLKIELDSKYVIDRVTKNLKRDEDSGYIEVQNADLVKLTVARMRERRTRTEVKWVKGHAGLARNEGADKLAGEATNKTPPTDLDMTINPSLRLSGAKLSKVTQALAYKAIRQRKMKENPPTRARTKSNLTSIKECAEERFGKRPTEGRIWKSFRHKDFSKKQSYFLWMATHDAYMVGSHWLRPAYKEEKQERARCKHCGILETMDHILTKCETPGQKEIWIEASKLWEKKRRGTWSQPILGTILASPLASFKDSGGIKLPSLARTYRILMIESAYLIWKLRCERVIQKEDNPFTTREVINRWVDVLNRRLALDQNLTNHKLGRKAISKDLVIKTWSEIILNRSTLPTDWTGTNGVLVGIRHDRESEGIG